MLVPQAVMWIAEMGTRQFFSFAIQRQRDNAIELQGQEKKTKNVKVSMSIFSSRNEYRNNAITNNFGALKRVGACPAM